MAFTRYAASTLQRLLLQNQCRSAMIGARQMSHDKKETDEEFDARYIAFFSKPNINSWEIRKGINDLYAVDLVADPKIVVEVLKACRRLNDYAMAVRFLESLKDKAFTHKTIYPYILQEIKPTLEELGISTPEEMGYGKPELYLQNPSDMH